MVLTRLVVVLLGQVAVVVRSRGLTVLLLVPEVLLLLLLMELLLQVLLVSGVGALQLLRVRLGLLRMTWL